jgi:adenosylcobyric acid synthase
MIKGFIINKFRGDPSLFADGMKFIEARTAWRSFGLVPYFEAANRLPAEDALALPVSRGDQGSRRAQIVVLAYPRISNFDDFDPLRQEPDVDLVFLRPGEPIPGSAAMVILPGSKSTMSDLAALRATGWDIDIAAHVRRGGHVLGICGGFQMLGKALSDPHGLEGVAGSSEGLGLLDVETVLDGDKVLREVSGHSLADDAPFKGYEMHIGRTTSAGPAAPMLHFSDGRDDGSVSACGRISGCYVHGLFSNDLFRAAWLKRIGMASSAFDYEANIDATLDRLAQHLEQHIDCDGLLRLIGK